MEGDRQPCSDVEKGIKIENQGFDKHIKCPTCDKIFKRKPDVDLHMKRFHLKIPGHKCNVCEKTYTNKPSLNSHKVIHKEKSFLCYICDFKAHRKQALLSHVNLVHLGKSPKPYFCQDCGKSFALKSHKLTHMDRSKLDKYPCDACGKLFGLVKNLRRHVKMQHTEGKYSNEFKMEVLEKVEKYGIQETSKIVRVRASTIDG